MKFRSLLKVGLGLLLISSAVAPALAQITRQGNGYLMRMKFSPNQTMRYTAKTTASNPAGGQSMNVNIPFSMRVTAVDRAGVATIEYTVGPMSMNGQSQGQPQKQTVKMDNRGRAIQGASAASQLGGNIGFPQGPVRVGQTWTADANPSGGAGPMGMKATYRLVGVRSVSGQQVAEVAVTLSGGNQGMQMSGSGTMFLRLSDGSLQSATLNQSVRMSANGQTQSSNVRVQIQRQ